MTTSAQVVERAVIRAYDLREEAKKVKLMGQEWNVLPPRVMRLAPEGALIEGKVNMVLFLGPDMGSSYRLQVDGQGRVKRYEAFDAPAFANGVIKEMDDLLLTGSITEVMIRLNHALGADKLWAPQKFAIGMAWAHVRANPPDRKD